MERITKLYEDIKDLEDVITRFNNSKNKIKMLENEIRDLEISIKSKEKENTQNKITKLENEYEEVLKNIKKIDLCSKECYTLTEIKAMLEFVDDANILNVKCLNYLDSLIYPLFIASEDFLTTFKPYNYLETFKIQEGQYKVLKINKELNDFFNLLRNQDVSEYSYIFRNCYIKLKEILSFELSSIIPSDIILYMDDSYLYLIFKQEGNKEELEEYYFNNINYIGLEYLHNLNNVIDIFNEIFKDNLRLRLLECNITDIAATNNFFTGTEFFITNIDEWKLDCVMKEVIKISKTERSLEYVSLSKLQNINVIYSFDGKTREVFGVSKERLPRNISKEFYRVLLCLNAIVGITSKRLDKANKIFERAIQKMLSFVQDNCLLLKFILFADLTLFMRLFPDSKILDKCSEQRDRLFFEISEISTELRKSINEPLMLLKVYFKEQHYDFKKLVELFVPPQSQVSFEINYFDHLFRNIVNNILCIRSIDNERIRDMSKLLQYCIDLSYNLPKDCIQEYKRFESVKMVFSSSLEDVNKFYSSNSLNIPNEELKQLIQLLFKSSTKRSKLLEEL